MKLLKLFLFLLPLIGYAGVNLKNGNFYISYTDIGAPGKGEDLKIVRTYNSKATRIGWFGFGWGSEFETFLSVSADSSIIIHENGSGAMTRFVPKTALDVDQAANNIVAEIRKNTTLSEKDAANLISKLKGDAELRHAYAKKFDVKGELAIGTMLYSSDFGPQKVEKIKDGYVRYFNSGKKEYFDNEGRISKIVDKNSYIVDFSYKGKALTSIKDSDGKQLFFDWYDSGKVAKITTTAKDKAATYKYEGHDLVFAQAASDHKFVYVYDGNHNMVQVKYSDNSKMDITYEPKTQFVSTITDRYSSKVSYVYGADKANPDFHYWTTVTKEGLNARQMQNKYEYYIKAMPDGALYTERIITEVEGIKTDTVYNEFKLPIKITRGNFATSFKYNENGLLTEKISRGELIKISYDEKHNKINRVENSKEGKVYSWTNFIYDNKGNLAKAESSEGKSVFLSYDISGRITQMVDRGDSNEKRTLVFSYGSLGKPVNIQMVGKGEISVSYDNYGAIKKVDSPKGHKMALEVTQAFQSLLSIVKPAGVNLNM